MTQSSRAAWARAIAPAPSTTSTPAATAPLTWPWFHWTSEPTVKARTMLSAARTTARRRAVARAAGRHGSIARPTAIAGAR